MEDLAGIHKRLSFQGIEIQAVHDGTADSILIGIRGLVGQMQREDGAKKVRRSMAGVERREDPTDRRAKMLHLTAIGETKAEEINRVLRRKSKPLARGWDRTLDDPILLPDGRELRTLRDAGNYIASLPKAESPWPVMTSVSAAGSIDRDVATTR